MGRPSLCCCWPLVSCEIALVFDTSKFALSNLRLLVDWLEPSRSTDSSSLGTEASELRAVDVSTVSDSVADSALRLSPVGFNRTEIGVLLDSPENQIHVS